MGQEFKKEVKQMALFWFLLPLIAISAIKTIKKATRSLRAPKEMLE